MATYLKRTSKLFDITRPQASANMNLRDLMCPVCRGILIEPVTLPCTHNLCLRCLKGTFEHNSLSCPLCRIRVGSWLRNATKSESLVNGELWALIRSRYPKEIQDKHNDDMTDINCDSRDYAPKLLSATGELRHEYKMQLHIAEAEMRRHCDSDRINNDELIRKININNDNEILTNRDEEELMKKTIVKKQLLNNDNNIKYYESLNNLTLNNDSDKYLIDDNDEKLTNSINNDARMNNGMNLLRGRNTNTLLNMKQTIETRKSNLNLLTKIQAERIALGVKSSIINKINDKSQSCCDYSTSFNNIVTLKRQSVTMLTNKNNFNSYITEPSCSNSMIYGDQNEEELRVPSDILNSNSNKKNLGIEICLQSHTTTITNDDKRIGSAQSAGSHDSINPEIHHFKPIKAIPRTPLKITHDGRQIDPKLLRVMPILKRITNPILKPPSQHMKRIIGCSWSAFKGRTRQGIKSPDCNETDWKSPGNPIQNYHHQYTKNQLRPQQTTETARKLDLLPDMSFDTNKNYTKNINQLLNDTKVGKKLIMIHNNEINNDVIIEPLKPNKLKGQMKSGLLGKRKQKNQFNSICDNDKIQNISPCCSSTVDKKSLELSDKLKDRIADEDEYGAMENIAERIKRRKVTLERYKKCNDDDSIEKYEINRKLTRSRALRKSAVNNCVEIVEDERADSDKTVDNMNKDEVKDDELSLKFQRKSMRAKVIRGRNNKNIKIELPIVKNDIDRSNNDNKYSRTNKVTRHSVRLKTCMNNHDELNNENIAQIDKIIDINLHECVIDDDDRIERLEMQEKKDYELAQKLQAKFNEMECISGRTRGSKRALERNEITINNINNDKITKLNGTLSNNFAVTATTSKKSQRRQRRG